MSLNSTGRDISIDLAPRAWVRALLFVGIAACATVARAAFVTVDYAASCVGDTFTIEYGLGSPSPTKTAYLYINGSCVDSATNSTDTYYYFTPDSSGDYTFDVYYSDSSAGPFDPTYNNSAGTYYVPDPPPPNVTGGSTTGTVGYSISYVVYADNYASTFSATGLPPGLYIDNNGYIYGTPTTAGTWNATVYASNSGGTGSATVTIKISPPTAPTITAQPLNQSPIAARAVAGGTYHAAVVRQDGAVWVWGAGGNGEIGNGTTGQYPTATAPLSLPGCMSIFAGNASTFAVATSGTVWSWGYNGDSQLGDGTTTDRNIPVQVPGLSGIRTLAVGGRHTLAVGSNGSVWGWGNNAYGQATGSPGGNQLSPVQVAGLSGIIAVAGGSYHSLALRNDGTVWAWGYNGYGQLGDGTSTNRTTPAQVPGLTGIVAIACGYYHNVAVKSDGTVWAWGYNGYGQLGDGTTTTHFTPEQTVGLSGIIGAAASYYQTIFLKNDGTVWGIGDNNNGQLGDGTTTTRYSPVQTSGIAGAVGVAAGLYASYAIKSDGTVWAWGYNPCGEIGDGTYTQRLTPVQTIDINDALFTFSVNASPAPTYQWQRMPAGQTTFSNLTNGSGYSGVNTITLRVLNPTSAMNGDQFRCVITNQLGSATTTGATLVIGAPTVSIVGGNGQYGLPSQFNSQAFDVAVWNSAGTTPLMGASVTFAVQSGGGQLATTNSGSPTLSSSLTFTTDIDGTAQAFYQQPSSVGITSQIAASSGGAQAIFTTQSVASLPTPSSPPWLHTASSSPTAISFSWGASTPASGGGAIAGYNIYRNGTLLNGAPQMSTTFTDTSVMGGTAYTYTVRAVDTSGALSNATTLTVSAPASSTSGTFDVYTPTP